MATILVLVALAIFDEATVSGGMFAMIFAADIINITFGYSLGSK